MLAIMSTMATLKEPLVLWSCWLVSFRIQGIQIRILWGDMIIKNAGQTLLSHMGHHVGKSRVLQEYVWPTLSHSLNPGFYCCVQNINVIDGIHCEVLQEKVGQHNIASFLTKSKTTEFGVHYSGYLCGGNLYTIIWF